MASTGLSDQIIIINNLDLNLDQIISLIVLKDALPTSDST